VLLSCKSLQVLHLTTPRDHGFPVLGSDGLGANDPCAEPCKKRGPLTELVYEAKCGPSARGFVPIWVFDWTQLRHLELQRFKLIDFIKSLIGTQLCLAMLILEYICEEHGYVKGRHVVEDLITSFRGLKRLYLINPTTHPAMPTISLHGDTIKDLTIRYPRYGKDPYYFLYAVRRTSQTI
jgi:hypothetical protein